MKIKFQADADLRDPIVSGVKRREPNSEAIDGLVPLWLMAEAEDWENVISFLPH